MKQTFAYAGLSFALVALVLAIAGLLLQAGAWTWLVVAGGMALGLQLALHLVLSRWRKDPKRFLKAIVAGASARLVLVVVALIWVAVREHPHPVAFMIGLAGFVCSLLMLEAALENSKWFQDLRSVEAGAARPTVPTEGVAHR